MSARSAFDLATGTQVMGGVGRANDANRGDDLNGVDVTGGLGKGESWDLSDPIAVNRLGTLARFSSLLADYEAVRQRSRPDPDLPGEQVGGEDRGTSRCT